MITSSRAIGGALDHLEVVALLLGEVGIERELRHADDAVHGRADLVAHVGQELTLGLVRTVRFDLGGAELGLASLEIGDVPRDPVEKPTVHVRDALPLEPPVVASGTPQPALEARGRIPLGDLLELPLRGAGLGRVHEVGEGVPTTSSGRWPSTLVKAGFTRVSFRSRST